METESINDELKMDNTEEFDIMVVPVSKISQYNFNDPNYLDQVLKDIKIVKIKPENFALALAQNTELNKYKTNNMGNDVFGFSKNYCFNIIYLELHENDQKEEIKNEVGELLHNAETKIYGNCLIFKTYLPEDNFTMKFESIKKKDMADLLNSRKSPNMVIYDNGEYFEDRVPNIETYSKKLFGEDYIYKKEINFYHHMLNVWYTTSDYGEKIFPNLIDKKIDRMICFTKTNIYKDDFSLDELNKIIKLSNKEILSIDIELFKQEKDELNRKIIKSKFRILTIMFKKYIKS